MKSSIIFVAVIFSVSFVTGCIEQLSIFKFKNIDGPILLPCPTQYLNEPRYEIDPRFQLYESNNQELPRGYAETDCTCITKSTQPQSNTCYNPSQCVETECTCVTKPSVPAPKCSAVTFVPLKQTQAQVADGNFCKRSSFPSQVDPECPCCNKLSSPNVDIDCKCSRQIVPACQCSSNCVPMKQNSEECICTCNNGSQNSVNWNTQCARYVQPEYSTASYLEPGVYPTTQKQYYSSLNSPYVYNSGFY